MYQSWVSYGYLFGNYQAGTYNCTRFILGQTDNNSGLCHINQKADSGGPISITAGLNTKNTVHTLKLSRGNAIFDGTNLTSTPVAGTANSYKIVLFGNNSKGTVTATKINPRIYYFKIYDNGVLVRDFVPAIRKSNSKPGLYDLVSEEFFINSGTGEFLYGNPGTYGINYLSQNTLGNCKGLYITGCPGIDNNIIVKSILKAQSENPKLERIRVDGINTTNGTYNEILKLSQLQGYYDNGSEYSKPVLNGTYTIDEWITSEMLSQVNNKIEGLTINTPKIIDWDELAVQTLDPEKPNYNPAVAIILNNNSKGTVLNDPIIEGGGRYFMTKTQAATITTVKKIFIGQTSVIDTNNIVNENSESYDFKSFIEFKYFTSVTSLTSGMGTDYRGEFGNCSLLEEIELPTTITSISITYPNTSIFDGCSSLKSIDLSNVININGYSDIGFKNCSSLESVLYNDAVQNVLAHTNCSNLRMSSLPSGLTIIKGNTFRNCSKITITELPATCNTIQITVSGNYGAPFGGTTSIPYLHFLYNGVINNPGNYARTHPYNPFLGTTYKIYVGNGEELHDKNLLQSYINNGSWSNMIGDFKTWYDFAIPHLTYENGLVTITSQRTADIYYTTDGTEPSSESIKYTEPFAWNGQGIIKTVAIDQYQSVYGHDFYGQTVDTPEITLDTTLNTITLSTQISGTTIYYSIDGTYPSPDTALIYEEPIEVTDDVVKIICFATKEGHNDSGVVSKIFVLDESLWGTDGDSSYFAVQCMDSTKPNYNPAVFLKLISQSKIPNKNYQINNGGYLTKIEALAITSISAWTSFTTITDNNGIINSSKSTYNFTNFDQLKYFGFTSIPGNMFRSCSKLNCSLIFPESVKTISDIITVAESTINIYELGSKVTTISGNMFQAAATEYYRIKATTPPTISNNDSRSFTGTKPIYVGNGTSEQEDNEILNAYKTAPIWSTYYVNRLDTWWNYLQTQN